MIPHLPCVCISLTGFDGLLMLKMTSISHLCVPVVHIEHIVSQVDLVEVNISVKEDIIP